MSFDHKAFEFDWTYFEVELAPLLHLALVTGDTSGLERFIASNKDNCKYPYDGSRLDDDWKEQLEVGDIQELSDFALTKYYEPFEEFGLNDAWIEVSELLTAVQRTALLGQTVGPAGALFDPGRQGSYFQSPQTVSNSVDQLRTLQHPDIMEFLSRLRAVAERKKGLYVTF